MSSLRLSATPFGFRYSNFGFLFHWPLASDLSRHFRHVNPDVDVREPPANRKCHPARHRANPLHHRAAVGASVGDLHPLDVAGATVLGIRLSALQHLLDEPRSAI